MLKLWAFAAPVLMLTGQWDASTPRRPRGMAIAYPL